MSIGGSSSGIRFSGLSSGLDIDGIVSQLMRLESFPIQRIQNQQALLEARQEGYSQFRTRLNSLGASLSSLNTAGSFNPAKAGSSDATIADANAGSSAVAGSFSLRVDSLAQTHKVSSAAQASVGDSLNQNGTFILNGKAIAVTEVDSLQQVAAKINSASAGVTASVINGGQGQAFLTMTSAKSGVANAIQASDLTGSVLQSIGLFSGTAAVRDSGTGNQAISSGFSSATAILSTQLGSEKTGVFSINGTDVAVNFATDSLQTLADRINSAGAGATATVVAVTESGATKHRLQLTGANLNTALSDPDAMLGALGILQKPATTPLTSAADARYSLDGLSLTSPSNTITEVVPGVTINLKKEGTTTLNFTRDNDKVKQTIKQFQTAFNDVVGFVRENSKYDKDTQNSSLLFGDSNLAAAEAALGNMVFADVGTGTYTNLTQIGFGLDSDGKLKLDESKLETALTQNPDAVRSLMMAAGSSTNPNLRFVSASNKTLPSPASGYSINITQVATKSKLTANEVPTGPNSGGEVLTFGGSLFGNASLTVTVDSGSNLSDLVNKINGDSRFKDLLVASIDQDGKLSLEAKRWGAAGGFTLVSNLEGAGTSGVGLAPTAYTLGVDVAGTINGEEATGNGQFLLGKTGNSNTEGLQIQYSGTTTGAIGNFTYTRGLSQSLLSQIDLFTDGVNGQLSAASKSIQDQIEDMTTRIKSMTDLLAIKEVTLREKFGRMEQLLGQMQSQGAQLSAALQK
ncbi:MAG: flagellar filament capping protein FliD [Fimbriimonadaceae bacterium]|jgi:flagellar hook-associated protein 2|nr:flagellar filament capping protein FliD [Fimbriimonadaceae bacterium]